MLSLMAHPCGQGVDPIRRPYRTLMRTSLDLPPVEVCWFKAPPGAKILDVDTPFHSRDWDTQHENPNGLGEVWPYGAKTGCDFREYAPGCVCVPYTGQHRCGSDEVWRNGGVVGRDPVITTDANGAAPCCYLSYHCPKGGEREGGHVTIWTNVLIADGGEREGGHVEMAESCEVQWGCLAPAIGGEREGGHVEMAESCEVQWGCLVPAIGGEREGGHVEITTV